jgi:hypothetical protein
MTVSELIEELQKFPPHHRVFVNHDTTAPESCHPTSDWAPVYDVRADDSCTVIIDAEPWR